METSSPIVSRPFRVTVTLTALFTFLLIVIGALVRVSGSGLGCPDWPLCHGSLIPPLEIHTLIEYSHRLTASLVTFLTGVIAVWAALRYRSHKWIFLGTLLAVGLLFVQIVLGAITVLLELSPTVVAIHLGNGMLLFAAVLTVATLSWREDTRIYANAGRFSKLVVASAIGVFVIILSGALVAGSGASWACTSWPGCSSSEFISGGDLASIHMLHRLLVGTVGLFALYTFDRSIRMRAQSRAIFVVGIVGATVLIAQIAVGAAQVWLLFPAFLTGAHVALAAATWGALVVLAQLARGVREAESERKAPNEKSTTTVMDYIQLTKPWIVALLLTTTFAAMLIAARGLPRLDILALTLIGGACAAGGSNALNSYIDRDADKMMGRTSRRPLPSGRISPRNALVFAVTLSVISPIILGLGVNWLSAGLAVLGNVYYAGIYTVLLKRATPQNIVVGGAAGAIPPLVGWAAVTNDVSLLALYLFAIILLWTPPHTWALMLLLDKDYQRVQIPMLPAAWGQVEARRQIILYSILLFVITLIPFSIGQLGFVYLLGAVVLGIYFLRLAVQLWQNEEMYKPIALKLYRFSNAYLALLFLAMVIDHWLPGIGA